MYFGMAPIFKKKSFVRPVNRHGVGVIFESIIMETEIIKNIYIKEKNTKSRHLNLWCNAVVAGSPLNSHGFFSHYTLRGVDKTVRATVPELRGAG